MAKVKNRPPTEAQATLTATGHGVSPDPPLTGEGRHMVSPSLTVTKALPLLLREIMCSILAKKP